MPNLVTVELMRSDGSSNLTVADVKRLQEAAPEAVFHYSFDLFGKTVSTTDERIEFVKASIGNAGEQTIRDALDILQSCKYFLLDTCGLDDAVLASIREDYPRTEVVWRIYHNSVDYDSVLTDSEVLRAVYGVTNTNCQVFKYMTKVKYMDLGHNTELTNLEFIRYMPDLEICILSGSPIKNLDAFENCKKLIFLEAAYCTYLTDISGLAGCASLANLNVSYTGVKDLTAVEGLPLERLMFLGSKFSADRQQQVKNTFPGCWVTFSNSNDFVYGLGWRYDKEPLAAVNFSEIYKRVREVFNLDKIDQTIQNGKN